MRAKLCAEAGCQRIVPAGQRYCAEHAERHRRDDNCSERWARQERAGDYHTAGWRRAKAKAVREHPFCAKCGSPDRLEVHHIRSVRLHPELMLDESNLQVLCHACHAVETRREIEERRQKRR